MTIQTKHAPPADRRDPRNGALLGGAARLAQRLFCRLLSLDAKAGTRR